MTLAGLVAQAYPSPEWAVFYEVGNATGFGKRRSADAVAFGIWPSRGQTLVGFEFKESRSDWLRERKNPAKAEEIAQHCDAWWLVVGDETVAKPDELPEPWGLYVANKDRTKLRNAKQAQIFPDRDKTTMRRMFAAAMLRRVGETMVPKAELDRLVEERVKASLDRSRDGQALDRALKAEARLRDVVLAFEAASGVRIDSYRGPAAIGRAVQMVLDVHEGRRQVEHIRAALSGRLKDIDEALAAWPVAEQQTDGGSAHS